MLKLFTDSPTNDAQIWGQNFKKDKKELTIIKKLRFDFLKDNKSDNIMTVTIIIGLVIISLCVGLSFTVFSHPYVVETMEIRYR